MFRWYVIVLAALAVLLTTVLLVSMKGSPLSRAMPPPTPKSPMLAVLFCTVLPVSVAGKGKGISS